VQTGNLRLYADAQDTSPYAMSVFVALEVAMLHKIWLTCYF
jgi:hypothetical protein